MAALVALDEDLTATTATSTRNVNTVIGEEQPSPPRRPLSSCSAHLPACKRLCCSHSRQPQQQHQQEQHLRGKKLHRQSHRTRLLLHTTVTAPFTAQTMQPSHATLPEDGCEVGSYFTHSALQQNTCRISTDCNTDTSHFASHPSLQCIRKTQHTCKTDHYSPPGPPFRWPQLDSLLCPRPTEPQLSH